MLHSLASCPTSHRRRCHERDSRSKTWTYLHPRGRNFGMVIGSLGLIADELIVFCYSFNENVTSTSSCSAFGVECWCLGILVSFITCFLCCR
ncbi:hypothetical protein BS78_01G196200 [Paspalum vaginatum]|nr:hypothetical protein BS78_01G196200 [Paspalum vaginatum]